MMFDSCHFWSRLDVNFSANAFVHQVSNSSFYNTADIRHNYDSVDRVIVSSGNSFDTATPYVFGGAAYTGLIRTNSDYSKGASRFFNGVQRSSGKYVGGRVEYVDFPPSSNITLTNVSPSLQVFVAVLAGDVTITLPSTNYIGLKFRIVRAATATGAFNLVIGAVKTLTTAGTWADVEYDGTQYTLTASGTL
jgi:hypothetical protein